jgi:hypothetical protein
MKQQNKNQPTRKEKKPFDIAGEIHRLGVLMEAQGDEIRLVAEEVGNIRKTQDEQTAILSHHTEAIEAVAVNLDIVKDDVAFVKNSLKLEVDAEEFSALERRVTALEKRPTH